LDRIGLPEEKLELLLAEINIYCFKQEMDEKEFVSKMDDMFQMANDLGILIPGVLEKISQKKNR
jgi:hypothetical protein